MKMYENGEIVDTICHGHIIFFELNSIKWATINQKKKMNCTSNKGLLLNKVEKYLLFFV